MSALGIGRTPRLALALGLLASTAGPVLATESFDPKQAEVRETKRWGRLELLEDKSKHLPQERYIPLVEHHAPEIRAAFKTGAPSSQLVLLHYAKGWKEAQAKHPDLPPVILVHGAGMSSNHCFASHPIEQPYEGLAARLTRAGRATFAVTFSHVHGDNYLQAEQLCNAIARVRQVTGAKKVDLVAHSKGGMPARIYLSSAGPKWTTPFRKDVRRYVMLGTPNGGIDVSFAYPNLNYWILEHKSPAPLSWTGGYYYGKWLDWADQNLYGPRSPFPGQAQMVARFRGRYGLTTAKGQLDVETTYEGGRGQVSEGFGIDRAIKDGGNCIAQLKTKPIHPSVELAALAGTGDWIMGLVGERRAPSDGLLLVSSALDTDSMTKGGATLIRRSMRRFNHLQLVYDPRANDWVEETLAQK